MMHSAKFWGGLLAASAAAGVCLWLALGAAPLGPALPDAPAARSASGATWHQLQAHEQQALAPLAERWAELTPEQRSKWQAIAQQFDKLTPTEQQVMQDRMAQWGSLSPTQRQQARLHFNSVQSLPKDEKKSRWDAYQALSDDEKKKWSSTAIAPAKTAAPSPRPTAPDRLIQPAVRSMPPAALPARTPIDRHTLLPITAHPAGANTPQVPEPQQPPDATAKEGAMP